MWGALVARFVQVFQTKIGQWGALLLVSLGLGIATQVAVVAPALDLVREQMILAGNGAGHKAMQWFAFLNMDKAITMVLSAYGARAAVRAGKAFLVRR